MEFGVTSLNRVFGVLSTPESRSDVSRIVTCFSFVFSMEIRLVFFVSLDLDYRYRIFFLVFTASDACDVICRLPDCNKGVKVLLPVCASLWLTWRIPVHNTPYPRYWERDSFIYLFIYLFICLFVCLFVCLFIYLFIYLL